MTEMEKYAVTLVASGAESVAEDDLDEDGVVDEAGVFASEDEWRGAAGDLGVTMARAIRNNPEGFLAWFRSVST